MASPHLLVRARFVEIATTSLASKLLISVKAGGALGRRETVSGVVRSPREPVNPVAARRTT